MCQQAETETDSDAQGLRPRSVSIHAVQGLSPRPVCIHTVQGLRPRAVCIHVVVAAWRLIVAVWGREWGQGTERPVEQQSTCTCVHMHAHVPCTMYMYICMPARGAEHPPVRMQPPLRMQGGGGEVAVLQ